MFRDLVVFELESSTFDQFLKNIRTEVKLRADATGVDGELNPSAGFEISSDFRDVVDELELELLRVKFGRHAAVVNHELTPLKIEVEGELFQPRNTDEPVDPKTVKKEVGTQVPFPSEWNVY